MIIIIPILLFLVGFTFRAYGFFHNYPFWVDEFSSAVQAQYILKYGLFVFSNPQIYFEHNNILTYFTIAGAFKIFGTHEWVARLPSVIIGSCIPVLVYIIAKYFFGKKTALSAGLLTAFSYFQITWSRQARSYIFVQFFILLVLYLYFKLIDNKTSKKLYLIFFIILNVLGLLTHFFYYVFFGSIFIHYLVTQRGSLTNKRNKWLLPLVIFLLFLISWKAGLFELSMTYLKNGGFLANNAWYYHSFLWREYGLITFLAITGFLCALSKKNKSASFLGIYIVLHLIFITFIFKPYSSRYLLPIFPFLLIMTGYALTEFSSLLSKNKEYFIYSVTPALLTLFIIVNGYKFVNKPKIFYSVNHDFRDIALIDYKRVYDYISSKGEIDKNNTAVIETWNARTYWYLGIDYRPTYQFKWKGNVRYARNANGEKIIPKTNNLILIEDVMDLKKAMTRYPKGFIFIDDSSLPQDVIEFAQKNLKKELYLDHYPLDDNPYSIWPATLYSWGV